VIETMHSSGLPVKATAAERDRARRSVAIRAADAADCAQLLAMLGLGPHGSRWDETPPSSSDTDQEDQDT